MKGRKATVYNNAIKGINLAQKDAQNVAMYNKTINSVDVCGK